MNNDSRSIINHYGNERKTDINEHLEFIYDRCMEYGSVGDVLECGVREGESTIILLAACRDLGKTLYSVDIEDTSTGLCRDAYHRVSEYGLLNIWKFHKDDSVDFMNVQNKKWGFIFVDTAHTYKQTARELEATHAYLLPGGIAIFHDTISYEDGVGYALRDFMVRHSSGYRYENRANNNGLGVLRRLK